VLLACGRKDEMEAAKLYEKKCRELGEELVCKTKKHK
jgi:hypothetical protein